MRRRSFIGGLLGVATTRSAWAQPRERVQRIGTLMPLSRGASLETEMAVFSQALDALGWKVGTNPLVESWWASDYDRMLSAARALVRLEPNVLLVGGAALPSAVEATKRSQSYSSWLPTNLCNTTSRILRGLTATLLDLPATNYRWSGNASNCSRRSPLTSITLHSSTVPGIAARRPCCRNWFKRPPLSL